MNQLINAMKMHAMQGMSGFTGTRQGVITAYDPNAYAVKVQIQPTGEETGWIPLSTPWVGNGWGLAAGPMIDAVVEINFDSGTIGVGMVSGQFYNDVDRCPGPPSGEFWLVHKSGSLLKFTNDGNVLVVAAGTAHYTAQQHVFDGPVQMNDTLNAEKQITSQADITDNAGSNAHSMAGMRQIYNGHDHPVKNVQGGSSTIISDKPEQQT
jgi:uncharacterized protein involved in type VI secretion and phage assembly